MRSDATNTVHKILHNLFFVIAVANMRGFDEADEKGTVQLTCAEYAGNEVVGEGLATRIYFFRIKNECFEERTHPLRGKLLLGEPISIVWEVKVYL